VCGYERRQEGDYQDLAIFTESEVTPWINDAKIFVSAVKTLIEKDSLNN
jgi:uncharacterized protein (UPF0332 family)